MNESQITIWLQNSLERKYKAIIFARTIINSKIFKLLPWIETQKRKRKGKEVEFCWHRMIGRLSFGYKLEGYFKQNILHLFYLLKLYSFQRFITSQFFLCDFYVPILSLWYGFGQWTFAKNKFNPFYWKMIQFCSPLHFQQNKIEHSLNHYRLCSI